MNNKVSPKQGNFLGPVQPHPPQNIVTHYKYLIGPILQQILQILQQIPKCVSLFKHIALVCFLEIKTFHNIMHFVLVFVFKYVFVSVGVL